MVTEVTDMDWPKRRRRYATLRETLRRLDVPDRSVDAELAWLLTAAEVVQQDDAWRLSDGSPLPAYTGSRPEAAILWFRCLLDEPIPEGGPITMCRRLVEEAKELFE